tara:strand:- start:497 stop:1342 length:846 start_codon:yes stop_codon:yes gene_type:complete
MGEDKQQQNYKTYAVDMKSIRADWILHGNLGLTFMNAMLRKKNREVFMTPYMQIIIQFLYDAYSRRIMLALLPPYLLHLLFVNIQLFANESMRDQRHILDVAIKNHDEQTLVNLQGSYDRTKHFSDVVVIICGMFNILNTLVWIMQTRSLGWAACYRIWSIVDFNIIITNFMTLFNKFYSFGTAKIRIVEAILILSMWFKSMYYMRLVTEIAPLVESIFVIMNDMLYFLLIFLIGIVAFSEAFFIIGKNQVMYERETEGYNHELDKPSYATFEGALLYGYM